MKNPINFRFNFTILILGFLLFFSDSLKAQSFKDNIVKLTSVFPDFSEKSYFGFICAVENDSLYIVTTFDLFLSYNYLADTIITEYYNSKSVTIADAVMVFIDRTCLLLKTKKPEDFVWNESFCYATSIENGNRVGIIGRYGQWNDLQMQTSGIVVKVDEELVIDIQSSNPGSIGAPVIYNDCIAGLTTTDQGNQIKAIKYRDLKRNIDSYFNRNDEEAVPAFNLPYVLVGLKTGPFIRVAYTTGSTMKFPDSFNWGFYLQTGIIPSMSVRYERVYSTFYSFQYNIFNTTYQFRNCQDNHALRLLLIIGDEIERGNLSLFYEIGFNHHNPELRVNKKSWRRLDAYNEFTDSYSDKYVSYCAGIEVNGLITKKILLGVEFSIKKSRNKYLFINPIEPFKTQEKNIWMFNIELHTGIVFGNKEKSSRFLKPDRINPFRVNIYFNDK